MDGVERWDVLDAQGQKQGYTRARGEERQPGEYSRIVDAWIRNSQGQYLITRRCPDKHPYPGAWEPTCGQLQAGESSAEGAVREVLEETGLAVDGAVKVVSRVFDAWGCHLDVWLFESDAPIDAVILQPGETDAAQWATLEQVRGMMQDGRFIGPKRIDYLDLLP